MECEKSFVQINALCFQNISNNIHAFFFKELNSLSANNGIWIQCAADNCRNVFFADQASTGGCFTKMRAGFKVYIKNRIC